MTGYQIAKNMISVFILVLIAASILIGIRYAKTKKKKQLITSIVLLFLMFCMYPVYFMISVKQYSTFELVNLRQFSVSSEDLQKGVWNDVIANTDRGENLSPQLSWDKIQEADAYVIYMIDPDGNNWLHMKSGSVVETSISRGQIRSITGQTTDDPSYIGPYPPAGTHHYEIYVFALRQKKDGYYGTVNVPSEGIEKIGSMIDVYENGDVGNVIAYGKISGTYTK